MVVNAKELNNYYLNTNSQKLYRVSPVKNYIIDKIDNNQRIKRLSRYLTMTPLLNKGMSYNGSMLQQPDLMDSLKEKVVTDMLASVKEPILATYPFSEEILSEKKLKIYVYSPRTSVSNPYRGRNHDLVCEHLFVVEIVYPIEYDRIEPPYGQERANLIACEILNAFDGVAVDDELKELIGECEFEIFGDITNLRLSKAGYMITTIPITVSFIGIRTTQREVE